jgi:cobaltochelatase CobS
MRTHAKPQPIASAIAWMKRRNATHLYLVVDPATKRAIKIGSIATCQSVMSSNDGLQQGWKIVTMADAQTMIGDTSTHGGETVYQEYEPTDDEVLDTTSDDAATTAMESTKPAATGDAAALIEAIRRIAGDSINESQVRAIVDERLSTWERPQATVVEVKHPEQSEPIPVGTVHCKFPELLAACNARDMDGNRLNVLLMGPAGTSKSTAARQVAKALNLSFFPMGAIDSKYELFGFMDANGNAVETAFKKAWRDGGVFSFDELSASSANAVLAFNGCLATGIAPFPDGAIERHPDCVIIASDNVFGAPNATYNARNKMDDAFMDRFIMIEWPIDEALELAITGNDSWVKLVHKIRNAINDKGIRGVSITPRASIYGASLIRAGMDVKTAARLTCRKSMTAEQWATIESAVGL